MTAEEALDSPALSLLLRLEDQGFDVAIKTNGQLRVKPAGRLTATQRQEMRSHRAALVVLVRLVYAVLDSERGLQNGQTSESAALEAVQ